MVAMVRVKQGEYRNSNIVDTVFPLVKPYQVGAKGGYITVDATEMFGEPRHIRIKVAHRSHFEFVSGDQVAEALNEEQDEVIPAVETDDQVMDRIRDRFEILDEMTKAAIAGDIRAVIVAGPPGVGKSFGVEREIDKAVLFDHVSGTKLRAEVVKGSASPIGLYQTLYRYSDPNCVLVFDDCDTILLDDVSLNLLKGALDTGKKRKISWLSESRVLREEGIPSSFEFKGSVIFITNIKFDKMKNNKLKDHLEALQSRCHYLDLTMDTMREKILRIKQIARDGELFADYDFEPVVQDEIIEFMDANKTKLREVSLRMAIKIADLRKSFPIKWKAMAATTCMKTE